MPLVVGLTGGVASGKSEAARRFEEHGVPALDADVVARALTAPGRPALARVVQRFGPDVLGPDGSLDRAAMRRRVFSDQEQRRALEGILHPLVEVELRREALALATPYVVVVIPLLAEVGRYAWLDRVVVVDCEPESQRERLMRRDGIGPDLADRMLMAQADRSARLALADYVLSNRNGIEGLRAQVDALHARLLAASYPPRPDE